MSFIELLERFRKHTHTGTDGSAAIAAGAPTNADYLVGTANGSLSAEIVVGATPGGELGGTWAAPTVDATHSGSAHHAAITLATEQATTSGTSIDFTGIPSGTKRITVMLVGVSTNGTSVPIIQLGDSGGVETTGYAGTTMAGGEAHSAGFRLDQSAVQAAAVVLRGAVTLTLEDSSDNTWVCTGIIARTDLSNAWFLAGTKALSATLDRVRLTTENGTDTFDAGAVNISYE